VRLEGGGGVGIAVDSRHRFAGGPSELLGLPRESIKVIDTKINLSL